MYYFLATHTIQIDNKQDNHKTSRNPPYINQFVNNRKRRYMHLLIILYYILKTKLFSKLDDDDLSSHTSSNLKNKFEETYQTKFNGFHTAKTELASHIINI